MTNILVWGSGGREHAMANAVRTAKGPGSLFFAPGNAGVHPNMRRPLKMDDFPGVIRFCKEEKIGLVAVGPEGPLCDGFVDEAEAAGVKAYGPNKLAAEFEGDKHLTKRTAMLAGIRTADYQVANTLEGVALAIRQWGFPIVLKYPYLAAGKGVKVARDHSTAGPFARAVLEEGIFKKKKLLVEKFIPGRELSFFAVSNGDEAEWIGEACDYKLATNQPGENRMTGGMGAYSPVPWVTPHLRKRIKDEILDPFLRAAKASGRPYKGTIYLGLMIDPQGNPWLIEINCRLGDPETQVVLPRLEDGVFLALMLWSLGLGPKPEVRMKSIAAVYTVLCAAKYPETDYEKGYAIGGIGEAMAHADVIHAGTELADDCIVGTGGRVLGTLGLAPAMDLARGKSQLGAALIAERSNGMLRFRNDIAAGI